MGRRQDPDRVVLGHLTATPMRERGERDGKRYWRIRHRTTRETVTTGWWTREEVDGAIAGALKLPTSSRRSAPAGVRTIGELLDQWAAVQQKRKDAGEIAERSLVNYRQAVRHWKSAIADVLVTALTRELAEDTLRTWRAVDKMAARSAKLAADVLASVVKWAAPRGLCPAVDVKQLSSAQVDPEERVNCEYTPTRDEASAVLAVLDGRARTVVELLGLTGARIGEVAALTVGSWDRERRELLLSGRDRRRAKRGKVRTRRWPVVGRLAVLLDELAGERDGGEPLVADLPIDCSDLVRRALEAACEAAEVERYTAHGLRRLVALELLDETDPRTVSELTGHSVQVLLRDYIRPRADRMRDVVGRAHGGRRVLELVEGGEG